jgi:MFS family permease
MQTVGAQWYLVEVGASPTVVALVQTANMAPVLLFSLMAGVLADAFDRRRLIIGTNLFAALGAAALTVSTMLGLLGPISLLAYTFLIGAGVALSSPAWQAIQPDLVPRAEIQSASALGGVTVNAARAIGPSAAGVLVAWAGPAFVFGLNAVSFVTTALAVYFWRSPATADDSREKLGEALAAGLRYVRYAPRIKRILLRTTLFTTPASALWALLPVAANGHLGMGSAGYGLLLGALGAGALVGVVALPQIRARAAHSMVLSLSAVLFGIGTVAAGYLPAVAVATSMVVAGAAWISSLSTFSAVMQLTLPAWVRARGMAMYLFVMGGTQAVGALGWGAAATAFGYGPALAASAVLLILSAASILVWPLLPGTGHLDRTVGSSGERFPSDAELPVSGAGPVTVMVSYRLDRARLEEFTTAMSQVRLSRLRTGATEWRLMRQMGAPHLYTEIYSVPTWCEYRRQEEERLTGQDRRSLTLARHATIGSPIVTVHLPE